MSIGTLVKLSDDKFEGKHPNGIVEGSEVTGVVYDLPKVGSFCAVGKRYTSTVIEIIKEDEEEVIFKTLNSTYQLKFKNKNNE